jgi:hypothetical protein
VQEGRLDCWHFIKIAQESYRLTQAVQTHVDLVKVHELFAEVLRRVLGDAVPIPEEVAKALESGKKDSAPILDRWLALLDLAIAPPQLRSVLQREADRATTEALLRYYIRKSSPADDDRDKADLVATALFRQIMLAETINAPNVASNQSPQYEEEICLILHHEHADPLSEEYQGLVREFPSVCQQVEQFRQFDELMDSGVIQRVRDIKARFGRSFYHPRVLATAAQYNVYFGRRFDELFQQAAQQIQAYALALQTDRASTPMRVDGDIPVEQLAQISNPQFLESEYRRAQEEFRKVSRLRKVASRHGQVTAKADGKTNPASSRRRRTPLKGCLVNSDMEEVHLRQVADQIREFVSASAEKTSCVVPLRNVNVALAAAETEAFRADFGNEKSFRADYAAALRRLITLQARISTETREFESKVESTYLWKPHAMSLLWLIHEAQATDDECGQTMGVAQQRGLTVKSSTLEASRQRLRLQIRATARILERAHEIPELSQVV